MVLTASICVQNALRNLVRALAVLALGVSPVAWAGVDWVVNNSDTGFDPVAAGGDIVYTVRVNNNGDIAAPSTTLTLGIPATTTLVVTSGMVCAGTGPVTCTVPALAIGGNAGDSATVLVTVRTTVSGTVNLAASVPVAGDDDGSNNAASEPTTVNAGADMALSLSGPASVPSGSSVTYTFTALNNGPNTASAQTLSFPIPTGLSSVTPPGGCTLGGSTYTCSVPALANGASTTRAFTGQISVASGSTVTPVGSIAATGAPVDPITANNTATFNTTVTAGSDVRILKSRAPGGALVVGAAVTFTLTPSYTGDSPTSLTITDTLPANYTVGAVASPQNGWACGVAGQTVTCTKPAGTGAGNNVALGVIAIPATAASPGAGVTNTATISAVGPTDPIPANNSASDTPVTITAATVDLRANKSGPAPPLVVTGVPYTYSISTTNIGSTGFFGTINMVDALPAGVTVNSYTLNGWSCAPAAPVVGPASITCTRVYTSGARLAAGATTPSVVLNVTASATGGLLNSLSISSPDANIADTNPANDSTSFAVTSSPPAGAADLSVLKSAAPTPIPAGDVLTFTLEIVNSGPQTANTVTLTDNITSLINNLVGPTGAGYISESISPGVATGGSCSTSSGGVTQRNLSCSFTTVPVCNVGVDCPVITVQVRPGGNAGARTNTVSVVSSATADPDSADRTASAPYTVEARADVTVSKNASAASVAAGQNLTYVVTASNTNSGLSQAANVTITDTLPNDVTFVSATPSAGSCSTTPLANSTTGAGNNQIICNTGAINTNAQRTVTILVRPNTVTRGSTLTNNVSVSTTTIETNAANNTASVGVNVLNPVLDLLINKTDSVDPVAAGDLTVYTISVTNSGPSAAENVSATDLLPPARLSYQSHTVPVGGSCPVVPAVNSTGGTLTCQVPYLAAGQSFSFTVTMRGDVKGVDTNTATVSSDEIVAGFDTNALNNSVNQTTTVRTKADLEVVSKIPSVNPVNLRDDFTFVVRVRNNVGAGLAEADNVVVSDTLPAGMELVGTPTVAIVIGTTTATSCTGAAGSTAFTCTLGTVSSGAVIDITMPVQLVSVSTYPQVFTNTASVATSSLDINPANNSNSGNVTVNSSSLSGRVFRDFNNDGLVTPGDTGIAGVTITLTGTSFDGAAQNVSVVTDAAGNYSFVNIPQGTYSVSEGVVAEAYLLDGIDTAGTAGGTVGADTVTAIALNSNTAATGYLFAEVPQARVGIAKAVLAGPATNADGTFNVSFRLVVENLGLEALNSLVVTDVLAGAAPRFGTQVTLAIPATDPLGDGQYTMLVAPSGSCGGLNPGFNGSAAATLASGFTLGSGANCQIDISLRVRPSAPLPPILPSGGRYENQALVTATGALSGQTSVTNPQLQDSSDSGANPDPDNDNQANEAGENDPTPVVPVYTPTVGIAKALQSGLIVNGDGSYTGSFRLVVENLGNEALDNLSISDAMTGGAPRFGAFVAGGPGATLAAGQFTIQTAPVFVGACATGVINPGFDGAAVPQAATIGQLPLAGVCTLDFGFRFVPLPGQTYTNQASTSGTGTLSGGVTSDSSDDGPNPDTDGDNTADEAGENDPTPVPIPRVGLAKSAGAVVNNGDGTYSVPFTLVVNNAGQTPLASVQVSDDLSGQFGVYTASAIPAAGQYTLVSGPTVGAQINGAALTAVAAGSYTGTGAGTLLLVAPSSSLPGFAPASAAQIQFTLRFFPTTAGPFNNSAIATGVSPAGGNVTDNSVDGAVPDANTNGDPGDDTSPTPVNISDQRIGVAKALGGVTQTGVRQYRVPYAILVENLSPTVTATNVQVSDSLSTTFPTAQSITLLAAPSVFACNGTLLNANAGYSGTGANTLLVGNQNLQPGERCTIAFTAVIDFGSNPLPVAVQNNQATATTAQTPGGTVIATDLSDNGTLPDPDGDTQGNEGGENDPTPVSFAAGDLSTVTGTVYLDVNHNRADDDGPPATAQVQGFTVEVLNSLGTVLGSAITDASGNYTISGLFPSTTGDPATYYQLRFREPVNGAIYGLAQSADPTPARNGTIQDGIIVDLQLAPGVTTLEQNLPLDPSGVVYDAVTRNPVAGAQVTLLDGVGAAVAGTCLVGGTNTQITGGSGMYQFLLLNPAPPGCQGTGTYTLQVVQPGGYLPPDSVLIPPTAGPYVPGNGGTDPIQAQAGAPTGADPTVYYTSFALTLTGVPATSSSNVVNNHIPLDPVLGGAIVLTKISPLVNVSVGQLVPYTITARNTLAAALANIDVRDTVPPGFKYVPGSATLDGVALEPAINGRVLTWPNLGLAANATRTFRMLLVVGAGVQPGEYINSAQAFNNLVPPPNSNAVSNVATATVRVIPDPTFDCSDLIGKVFDDRNTNGYQDAGEPGIANVRLATARGWLVTTDSEGRFHVACAAIPDADRGSNFIMKLDERTLPSGYRVTTENPRDVRLTRGKLTKLNFGAAIHKVVRVDMGDAAFEAGTRTLKPDWATQLAALPGTLKARPSVLRLGYTVGVEGEALARERLRAVSTQLRSVWAEHACCHTLLIEEELFLPAPRKEGQ